MIFGSVGLWLNLCLQGSVNYHHITPISVIPEICHFQEGTAITISLYVQRVSQFVNLYSFQLYILNITGECQNISEKYIIT